MSGLPDKVEAAFHKALETQTTVELVGMAGSAVIDCFADTTGLARVLSALERRWHAGDLEAKAEAKRLERSVSMVFESKDQLLCALASLARMGIGEPVDTGGGGT